MIIQDRTIIIEESKDLDILLMQYAVTTIDELTSILLSEHNITLVDHTDTGEYTQVNAQADRDFYDECLTLDEIEEIKAKNSIYGI